MRKGMNILAPQVQEAQRLVSGPTDEAASTSGDNKKPTSIAARNRNNGALGWLNDATAGPGQ